MMQVWFLPQLKIWRLLKHKTTHIQKIKIPSLTPCTSPRKFENKIAEFGRLAMWTMYVQSFSIIKFLTYDEKQVIRVIGLT